LNFMRLGRAVTFLLITRIGIHNIYVKPFIIAKFNDLGLSIYHRDQDVAMNGSGRARERESGRAGERESGRRQQVGFAILPLRRSLAPLPSPRKSSVPDRDRP